MSAEQNLRLLAEAATLLRPVLPELVFVGGCTTGLLITDPASTDVRPTVDVDVVTEIASYAELRRFTARLRGLGFREDPSPGAPVCRMVSGDVFLDVMTSDPSILGFTNRWYKGTIEMAQEREIQPALSIRVVTAPYFVGTKLEAFRGRGKGDFAASPDLEDLILVVDGRRELLGEVRATEEELRRYIGLEFERLLKTDDFTNALPGFLPPDDASQRRFPILRDRLMDIAALG